MTPWGGASLDSKEKKNSIPKLNQRPQTKGRPPPKQPDPKKKPDSKKKSKEDEEATGKPKKKQKPPPTERALINTNKFLVALRPLTYYVAVLGGSPFKEVKRKDGTGRFIFIPISATSLIFFIVAILNTITFCLLSIGLTSLFLRPDNTYLDTCGYNWEETMVTRHMVLVTVTWTWIAMSALSGWYVLYHGRTYSNFFSYWMRAIQRLDLDVTKNTCPQRYALSVDTILVGSLLFGDFFFPKAHAVNDTNAFLIQTMLRVFNYRIYEETLGKSKEYCGEYKSKYFLYSLLGLLIQIYTLFAARCFVNQFQFFSKLLGNTAKIWNNRLEATIDHEMQDDSDPYKRRLQMNRIMGDHLTIVQLYKLTENAYRQVLQTFYGLITFTLCVDVFFISRLGSIPLCVQQLEIFRNDPNCAAYLKALLRLQMMLNPVEYDVCSEAIAGVEFAAISSTLLLHTGYIFSTVTLIGAFSYLEAMKGYRVVRRHSYAECLRRKERNFVHSLQCSFAPTNPVRMAAGGYVTIERPLFISVASSILNYFIILLQFRPAQISITCIRPAIRITGDINKIKPRKQ